MIHLAFLLGAKNSARAISNLQNVLLQNFDEK